MSRLPHLLIVAPLLLAASAETPPDPSPAFASESATLTEEEQTAMTGVSWHEGCPVPLSDLRRLTVSYWGFDGEIHEGELVVHADAVEALTRAFEGLFEDHFPVEKMAPVRTYGGDDDASMAANNTSAFNCRPVAGGKRFSQHAYGRALDLNPVQNPYVKKAEVLPPSGEPFTDRTKTAPGMITPKVVRHFAGQGWKWGGRWRSLKDYQHFSANGR